MTKRKSMKRGYMTSDEVKSVLLNMNSSQQSQYIREHKNLLQPLALAEVYEHLRDYASAARVFDISLNDPKKAARLYLLAANNFEREITEEDCDSRGHSDYSSRMEIADSWRSRARELDPSLEEQSKKDSIGIRELPRSLFPGTFAVIGILSGIFFFSTSVTGNVIGLSNGKSSLIGIVLLVIGFVAGYFWARNKKGKR